MLARGEGRYLLSPDLRRLHAGERVARYRVAGHGLIQGLPQHEPDVLDRPGGKPRIEFLPQGRTLAYVYLDTNGDGRYEYRFNEHLISQGLARATSFSHEHRREFERLRKEAEDRGAGLWSACPAVYQ